MSPHYKHSDKSRQQTLYELTLVQFLPQTCFIISLVELAVQLRGNRDATLAKLLSFVRVVHVIML